MGLPIPFEPLSMVRDDGTTVTRWRNGTVEYRCRCGCHFVEMADEAGKEDKQE